MSRETAWVASLLLFLLQMGMTACASTRAATGTDSMAPLPETTAMPSPTVLAQSTVIARQATVTSSPASMTDAVTAPGPDPANVSPLTVEGANADVLYVIARQQTSETWQFTVTVSHPDTGWDDYADGWDVVLPNGSVIKPDPDSPFTRLLLHPHETEQPFTRSQSGIAIPPSASIVVVRAHDLLDGFGGREVTVDLSATSGEDFEVERLDG